MRRATLACVAASLVRPLPVRAQARKARIAFLGGVTLDADVRRGAVDPFRQALQELGYSEGRNLEFHDRWAEGKPDRIPGLAAELLQLQPDVLVTMGPRPAMVAKSATTTVSIVAVAVDNPVEMGLVADFARPGGNVTGVSSFGSELVAKRLQLLKDLVPTTRRVAVLFNPATLSRAAVEPAMRDFERRLSVSIVLVEARDAAQFDAAFEAIGQERADGVLVLADATFWTHRARLHELVAKHRLPSIWGGRDYLDGGGLASYQSDYPAMFRRAAALVDRILKGAKPAVTPFEQATKLELALNLRAAKAMGLTVPQSLLVAADEVIR